MPIDYAVLASGSGTNLQALIDADLPPPCVVVSDVASCRALDRARAAFIPTAVVAYHGDRAAFTTEVCDAVESHGGQAMVLAGFMRILGPEAIRRFPDRIVNLHPSMLPAFPGVDAVGQALAAGVTVTGVTVHFVDERVDHGPIIAQEAVPVLAGDSEESLRMRIQEREHMLYPKVVQALIEGRLSMVNGEVLWS
ncbi:MAG: phosphoribosylglycinamide formyltransferase [Acidimicrobiia bacterium]